MENIRFKTNKFGDKEVALHCYIPENVKQKLSEIRMKKKLNEKDIVVNALANYLGMSNEQ